MPDHRGPRSKGEIIAGCLLISAMFLTFINSAAIIALIVFE